MQQSYPARIRPPYRMSYCPGPRTLLEYEPVPDCYKRCAACGITGARLWDTCVELIGTYRVFPGPRFTMDGYVALCPDCKKFVLPEHRRPSDGYPGAEVVRPITGVPVELLAHGCADDVGVAHSVADVWRQIPRRDRKSIQTYLLDDPRRGCDVVSPRMLRIETLWDWPSRGRAWGMCYPDGRQIRLHARAVQSLQVTELRSLIAHELAHTFQWATGAEFIAHQTRSEDLANEREADQITTRWGFGRCCDMC